MCRGYTGVNNNRPIIIEGEQASAVTGLAKLRDFRNGDCLHGMVVFENYLLTH